ncbi:hypothetical protein E2986_13628 [Frieseomelitta varia]|uniref:Uncharacterized protein n=1 Tax=Frieseomelitta varia TaxID=561572 RepID=A0A833RIF4_9HYME|nr:hypothetical protein E2986_13628 [Frieseomelitta varia]
MSIDADENVGLSVFLIFMGESQRPLTATPYNSGWFWVMWPIDDPFHLLLKCKHRTKHHQVLPFRLTATGPNVMEIGRSADILQENSSWQSNVSEIFDVKSIETSRIGVARFLVLRRCPETGVRRQGRRILEGGHHTRPAPPNAPSQDSIRTYLFI